MNFAIATIGPSASAPLSAAASPEHRKLVDAAEQFEGMLLQEMLKPMREHGFCQENDDTDKDAKDDSSGFGDTLSSFGTETMATAIAKGGGLGIVKRVVEQVEGEKGAHDRRMSNTDPRVQK